MILAALFLSTVLAFDTWGETNRETETAVGMNESELIENIAFAADISKAEAGKAIKAFEETVTEALKGGDTIPLVGFGTFAVSERRETEGKNPYTGAKIKIPASRVPKFKAGKALKDSVNVATSESAVGMLYDLVSTGGCLNKPYTTYTGQSVQSCYNKCVEDNCTFFSMTSRHPGKCWTSTAGSFDPLCIWKEDVYANKGNLEGEGETADETRLGFGDDASDETDETSESAVGMLYDLVSTGGCLNKPYTTYTGQSVQSCYNKCVEDNCTFFSMTSRHPGKCWTSTAGSFDPLCIWKEDVYANQGNLEGEGETADETRLGFGDDASDETDETSAESLAFEETSRSTSWTATVTNVLAAFGLAVTAYGAFKHYVGK